MKVLVVAVLALFTCGCVVAPVDEGRGKAGGGTATVCHKGKKTMELPKEAVRAHLDHGDRMGPC
jgi:hypothetical protein